MAYTNLGQQLKSNLTSFLPTQQTQRPASDFSSLMATAQQQNAAKQKAQQTQFTEQAKQAATAGLGAVMPFQARNQYETQRVANQQQQAQGWLSGVNDQQQVARNQYETQRVEAQNKALADQQALQQKVTTDAPSIFQQWFPGAGLTYNKDAAAIKAPTNFTAITGAQLAQSPSAYSISRTPYAQFEDIFQGPTLDAMGQAQMQIPMAMLDFVKDPAEKEALFKELNQYAGGLGQYATAGKTAYDQFFTDAQNKLQSGMTSGLSGMQSQYEAAMKEAQQPWSTSSPKLEAAKQVYDTRQAELRAIMDRYMIDIPKGPRSVDMRRPEAANAYYESQALNNWLTDTYNPAANKANAANAAWVDQYKAIEPKYLAARSGMLDQYAGLYNKYNQGDTNFQQGALAAAYKAMEAARPQDQNLGSILSKYVSGDEMANYIKSKPTSDYSEGMFTNTGTSGSNIKYVLSDGTVTYTQPASGSHSLFGGSSAPDYTAVAMTPQEVAAKTAQEQAAWAAQDAVKKDAANDAALFAKYSPYQLMTQGYANISPAMQSEIEALLKTPEGMRQARWQAESIARREAEQAAAAIRDAQYSNSSMSGG